MCPNPGMILNIIATASLALPSAVSSVPRVQSHRSQRSASFGSRCPQNGQGILSPAVGSGRAAGASVYSMLMSSIEGHKARGIRQAQRGQRKTTTDYGDDAQLGECTRIACTLWCLPAGSQNPMSDCQSECSI